MARSSPQTDRIVSLIELLRSQPATGRSLTEIARHLGVAKATCYPMVVALTEAGWLVRHPTRKTYQLGPALVPIGAAAASALDVLDLARPAMHELADAADLATLAFVPSGTDLVAAEVAQPAGGRRDTLGLRVGDRVQVIPPLGSVVAAWFPSDALLRWYHAGAQEFGVDVDDVRAAYEPVLTLIRQRGYAVECFDQQQRRLAEAVTAARGDGGPLGRSRPTATLRTVAGQPTVDVLVGEIEPDRSYQPISINASAFTADAEPALVLCIVDAPEPMAGRRVIELGERVSAAAQRLTDMLHGRTPTHPRNGR
ncbi:helix-turn-helix domain-containing protein [Mycolicibacterium thermoresistibile]